MARPEDEALQRLVELTRGTLSDEATGRFWPVDESGLRRLEAGGRRRTRLRWQAVSTLGFAALLLVAAPAAWFAVRRPGPLTFEVINGTVGAAGEILPAEAGTRIRFSDGSEIALDREARAQVSDVTRVGARIVLSNGRAHTFFVPKPGARWQVAAGPYVVQVTGTIFDVQWSSERRGVRRLAGEGLRARQRSADRRRHRHDARPAPADAGEGQPDPARQPARRRARAAGARDASAGSGSRAGGARRSGPDRPQAGTAAEEVAPAHIPARVSHPM